MNSAFHDPRGMSLSRFLGNRFGRRQKLDVTISGKTVGKTKGQGFSLPLLRKQIASLPD
jgi:hypothetical protein